MKPAVRSRLLVLLPAVFVVLIDQLLKAWITAHLQEYVTVSIFPWLDPFLVITPIRNTGGVFGLLPQWGQVFKILSVLVILVVLFYQRSIPDQAYLVHSALGFVCGGALGNVIDRLTRGYVVDFFDANFWPFSSWPLFNVADASIVLGVALLILDAYFIKGSGHGRHDAEKNIEHDSTGPAGPAVGG